MAEKISPTGDLILNLLVARLRLGDKYWSFQPVNRATLKKLADADLVHIVKDTDAAGNTLVQITEKGKKLYMSETVVPPLVKENTRLKDRVKILDEIVASLSRSFHKD